jgi:hypothetical protein
VLRLRSQTWCSHHKVPGLVFCFPSLISPQAAHASFNRTMTEMILKCGKAVGGIHARLPDLLSKAVSIMFTQ